MQEEKYECGRRLIGSNPKVCIECGMISVDCECDL